MENKESVALQDNGEFKGQDMGTPRKILGEM